MSKKLIVLDIECLPNYWLIAIKGLESKKLLLFDIYGQDTKLSIEQRKKINSIMSTYISFGFNSLHYDIPMLNYALSGATCNELYILSKKIIEKGQQSWMTYKHLDIEPRSYDHFDIKEPAPAVMISLKNYGTRVGSKKLQEFYLDPHKPINKSEVEGLKKYCENDLDVTLDLYRAIQSRIELRIDMSAQYKIDLRSKSDAQIAEAVIISELKKHNITATTPELPKTYKTRYKAPAYITFKSDKLNCIVDMLENIEFGLADNGQVQMPKALSNKKLLIGNTTYKLGIGGLHSQEEGLCVESNDTHVLRNADVASYYPRIILNEKLYPKHLGKGFLSIYNTIVETRLKAKAEGKKLIAESLKITINGLFGKFGSKYSKVFSPDLLLGVTLTGQLTLLMMIETLEENGISVVSANTDGIEYFCPRDKVILAEALLFDIELISGFELEHDEYRGLYAANVNNYVAIYKNKAKAKGLYAEQYVEKKNDPNLALKKGVQTYIVFKAVREYLLNGSRIEKTISDCKDVQGFVSARTVQGGGVYDGEYLGKMVRWYYSTQSKGCISYSNNGNKVPKTDGAKPMMDMTETIPSDLDYDWYVNEAISKLKDLGVDYVCT